MNILYVEDDLAENIPGIRRLFSKYLSHQEDQALKSLETREYVDPEHIKQVLEESDIVEIEYRFQSALKKIIDHPDKYALFIIDRNLANAEYDFEEVNKVDLSFNNTQYEKYRGREGDYLFQKLVYDVDVITKFYFLTAYPAQADEIRGSAEIKPHIDIRKFTADNFIEKADEKDINKLKQEVIENIEILNLQNENKVYLDILKNNISEEAANRFLEVLAKKDSDKNTDIIANLDFLRNIFEKLLTEIAGLPGIPNSFKRMNRDTGKKEEVFIFDKGRKLKVRTFINWLDTSKKFDFNSLLRNFCYDIQEIASDFGPHDDSIKKNPSGYQATSNTVNALVYALKDIILWFGDICHQYKNSSS